jgi:HEPN domain-containing protein
MTGPADEVAAKVRGWAAHADDDLRVAEHTLTLPTGCPYRLVAYHAQQCAEKYLKGFLVLRGVDFPFTHNIARLLELCSEHANWADAIKDAEELTPFAITARYPGEDGPVSDLEARTAIQIAKQVRDTVRIALVAGNVSL